MEERYVRKYYVNIMGETHGPFSLLALEGMFLYGEIEDKTLARVEGSDEWVEVWTLVPSRFVIPDDEYPESWKDAIEERKYKAILRDIATTKGVPTHVRALGAILFHG